VDTVFTFATQRCLLAADFFVVLFFAVFFTDLPVVVAMTVGLTLSTNWLLPRTVTLDFGDG
jgi:hypothetical protein